MAVCFVRKGRGLMVNRKTNNKTHPGIRVLAILLVVVLGVAALLFREELFGASPESAVEDLSTQEPYTYENGADQQFDMADGRLAIVSSTGLQLLDEKGYVISRQVFTMKNPALCAGGKTCAFYDIGGTALKVFYGDELVDMDQEEEIIAVSVNGEGSMAVAAQNSGYKGSVTVYDPQGEGLYKWYSGSGYVLDAAISPNSSMLAVLCLEPSGSVVRIFKIGEETERASTYLPSELAFKLVFTDNNSLCLLSEDAMSFISAKGEELRRVDFEDRYLIDFIFTEELQAVVLSKYVSASEVSINSYGDDGGLLGSRELAFSPLCLSSHSGRLLVLGQGQTHLFSRDMTLLSEKEVPAGYGKAVLCSGSEALLLSSYHGEKITV